MDHDLKAWIDIATVEQLVDRYVSAEPDDRILKGDTGEYFTEVVQLEVLRQLKVKRAAVPSGSYSTELIKPRKEE